MRNAAFSHRFVASKARKISSEKRVLRGGRGDFDTLQNTLAGVVGSKKVRHDAFRVAGAGTSCCVN